MEKAPEQTPQQMAEAIEEFLALHAAASVLDDGSVIFDMRTAKYSLSQEHGRCTVHLWSEERNLVRRIVNVSERRDTLRLSTLRFGQSKPQTMEIMATADARTPTTRDATRRRYLAILRRVLQREFEGWVCDELSGAMDLERSFGPAYARGILRKGTATWAVVGVNAEESPATIDGVLTVGLLWLEVCRERFAGKRTVAGLRIIVPAAMSATTRSRLRWLRDVAQWQVFELDESKEVLDEQDAEDTGNLVTRLQRLPDASAANERFSDALTRAMEVVPDFARDRVETRLRSSTELALLLHGLEFARIRLQASANSFRPVATISFGTGAQETELTPSAEDGLRLLVLRLVERRHAGGSIKDPLYRLQPEGWLESVLRQNVGLLTDGQSSLAQFDAAHVYAQVPAFQSVDRGMLDLLTVTKDHRVAVLELKANEDMHFALQGLDYWLRIRWHHTQTVDAATGWSALQQHGYFPGMRLLPNAPRLFLVAPSLRIHPATQTVLRYFRPEVEWTLLGLGEKWRERVKVVVRARSTDG